MAHPDVERGAGRAQATEQRIVADEIDLGKPELAMIGRSDPAAELRGERLHAVTDPENRHPEPEHDGIDTR